MSKIKDKLKALGLSGKEVDIYLALLKIGSGTVMEISYKSGVNRCSTYDILETLNKRQLVTESYKGKKRVFVAQHPENLNIQPRHELDIVREILPDLSSLFDHATRMPRIEYHEGYEGLIYANDQVLANTKKEYFYFGSVEEMTKLVGHRYLEAFVRKRIEMGIWSNSVRVRGKETELNFMQGAPTNLRRVKYFPKHPFKDVAALYITDSRIIITSSLNEGYSMIIDSLELIALLRIMWDMIWSMAEE